MVDVVVLHQQHLVTLVSQPPSELFKYQLLVEHDLLRSILIAIGTRFAFFPRIKDDCELGWFERPVDELKSEIIHQLLIVVCRCHLDKLPLLCRIRHYHNRSISMDHRVQYLIHDCNNLNRIVKHEYDVSEQHRVVTTNHSLSVQQTWLTGDLMGNAGRQRILDVPNGGFSTVYQWAYHKD